MKYYIKIPYYRKSKTIFGWLIRIKQRYWKRLSKRYSDLSHVEILFPYIDSKRFHKSISQIWDVQVSPKLQMERKTTTELIETYGLWFASSEYDKGVRFKVIDPSEGNWVYQELEVSEEEYYNMLDYCIHREGDGYNYLGIVFQMALNIGWFYRPGDEFCSQLATKVLQVTKRACGHSAKWVFPGELYQIIEKEIQNKKQ